MNAPSTLPKALADYCARFDGARTTPLLLEGKCGPLAIGASMQSVAEADLINRTGRPILVDEIRVQCGVYDGTGGTVLNDAQNATYWNQALWNAPDDFWVITESPLRALQMRMTLGGIQLTRDFMNIYGLGPTFDLRSGAMVAVWRPPCPIYIEEGEFLRPELRYPNYNAPAILGTGGFVPNTNVTPHVSYACRVLEDPQDWLQDGESRVLPFASSYAPVLNMFAQSYVQSEDTALMNQLDTDLYVHALVGKCVSQIYDTSIGNLDYTIQNAVNGAAGPLANISENGIQVRMETSRGLSMVKDPVPFGHLFNVVDNTWWMNTILRPREFFRAYLDVDFTNTALYINDGSTVTPSITMHGSFFCNRFGPSTRAARAARDAEYAGRGVMMGPGDASTGNGATS